MSVQPSFALTERGREVLRLAREEALALNHGYIGTEHLLLGLLRENQNVAATVLRDRGVSLEVARTEIESICGRGDEPPRREIALTPRAKKVLTLALNQAQERGQRYATTEHLLLALVVEGEGIAAQVLRFRFGLNLRQLAGRLLKYSQATGL